ncbi:MAG: ribonuclease III [Patescibacteria group bacterium]|nr:MAG: ribonuclease III [Patescibacteria group bacterium]
MKDFSKFEKDIGVEFNDKSLLIKAFTHRSYINEHKKSGLSHNERLEFLGDAVLELVITRYLFDKYPNTSEGELTSYRAALVNTRTISHAAHESGMEGFLLLSRGEARDTGRARQYILANTFEAVIGAIYLDCGYDAAQEFIAKSLFHMTDEIVEKGLWRDAKSLFQEKAQEKVGITPSYSVLAEVGPDHDKEFTVAVFLKDEQIAEAQGKSKQEAEQSAASLALNKKEWS